jgi:hypothetical protein
MWGTLADHLADVALRRAQDRGADAQAAWDLASTLVDGLAARQPRLRSRPRPRLVGDRMLSIKGSCCLIYKAQMPADAKAPARPAIDAHACGSCPFRHRPVGERCRPAP